jgi:hypothetical protein
MRRIFDVEKDLFKLRMMHVSPLGTIVRAFVRLIV